MNSLSTSITTSTLVMTRKKKTQTVFICLRAMHELFFYLYFITIVLVLIKVKDVVNKDKINEHCVDKKKNIKIRNMII